MYRFRWPEQPRPGDVAVLIRHDRPADAPLAVGLKRVLKALLRSHGFACLSIHVYPPCDPPCDGDRSPAATPSANDARPR